MSSVLIVEDDAVLREILFEPFAKEHVCRAASTAERALALLSENRFDAGERARLGIRDERPSFRVGAYTLGYVRDVRPILQRRAHAETKTN